MPEESKVQLLVERACRALIIAYELPHFPADLAAANPSFPIYCGHEASQHAEDKPDYLDIIAGFPVFDGGAWGAVVTFQLLTAVADPDTRAAQTEAHALRFGDLRALWSGVNHTTVFAMLNAPIEPGIGFSGWHELPEEGEEGPAENDAQLVARPRYRFFSYLI